jgi:XRE family transcriptional regulator, regulator of sulfur utilization
MSLDSRFSMAEVDLGGTVRRLREGQGLSLRTLASSTGFSASFLSQVENGQASPSIASMDRIASALGVTLAQFFHGAESAPTIVRSDTRVQLNSEWSKARIEGLAGDSSVGRLDAVLITIEPGGMSGKHPYQPAREEFAMVLEGRALLTLGSSDHVLNAGDAVTILAGVGRRWQNPYEIPARVLVASSR